MTVSLRLLLSALVLGLHLQSAVLQAKRILDRTIITVNEDIILESDIKAFAKKLGSPSFQELFGGIDAQILKDRNALIQLLVDETLINQQVKKLQLGASDQEIEGSIRAILKRNGITQKQLNKRLKQLGSSLGEYREGIKRQIERKNLIDREIRPNLEVNEEQLRRFHQRHSGAAGKKTEFKIAHILIQVKGGTNKKAKKRATKIWKEVLANPKNFPKFVKDYSDDTATHETAGLLGFFSLSALSKAFRKVIPEIPIGKISKPIKTSAGYHIIKLVEIRQADYSTLPKAEKDKVRNLMVAQELEKRMRLWLERKKREAYIRKSGKKRESKQ